MLLVSGPILAQRISRDTCESVGGAWTQRAHGHSCTLNITDSQCLEKRTDGWQWNRRDAVCVKWAIPRNQADCEAHGATWGRFGARRDQCLFLAAYEAEKKSCTENGGVWERRGMLQRENCTMPTRDGGKPCTSSSQCELRCRALGRPVPSDVEIVGECARNNNPFGCHSFVENGRFIQGPCVD